jgi:dihydrolipoamide dehydrogenase
MVDRAHRVVDDIRTGLEGLIKANGISLFRGIGRFVSPTEVKVIGKDSAHLSAEKIIIATGSYPKVIPAFTPDGERIHDSTSLLQLKSLPKTLAVIGGGVIGCEFASMMNLLGVEVTIFEMLPRLIATEAEELSSYLAKSFTKKGIHLHLSASVQGVIREGDHVTVSGKKFEMALISVGRSVKSDELHLSNIGLGLDSRGAIPVNDRMETAVPGVYAVGDATGKWWLAHWGTENGIVAAKNAMGIPTRAHENAVPSVIFTDPEISSVGVKEEGPHLTVGKFPFSVLGKSQAIGETEGFVKILADRSTGQVVGAQVVGHEASTLIAEMTLAIANELTLDCITETIHAHPTLPEAVMEAAFVASGKPLHMPPKRERAKV